MDELDWRILDCGIRSPSTPCQSVKKFVHSSIRQFVNVIVAQLHRIRVLCVDDHRVMLDGLSLLIGRQPDMQVIASATNVEQAVAEYLRVHPDITLMDLQLPGMNGVEGIR